MSHAPTSAPAPQDARPTPADSGKKKQPRLSVNMNEETAQALKELAEKNGLSVTEAVRRAISVYKFVNDELESGRKILTMDPNEKNKVELFLV